MLSASEALTQLPDLDGLFAPLAGHARIGIAVSGGPDSLALMLLVRRWAVNRLHPPALIVYTVDHGLRAEAVEETEYVTEVAEKLACEVRVLHWSAPRRGSGIQAAAREARYALIAEAAREDGVGIVLTAHHRNDQAETILMRLAHGSGISGLSGMVERTQISGLEVFRPLLSVAPETLGALLAEAGIEPVADPSNSDTAFERVRWRQALPVLADLGLDAETLLRFSRRAARADEALVHYARESFALAASVGGFGEVEMSLAPLDGLPEEVSLRVLGEAIAVAGGGRNRFALGPLERLHREVFGGAVRKGQTLCGCKLSFSGDRLTAIREAARIDVEPVPVVPGGSVIWDQRFIIEAGEKLESAVVVPARSMTRDQAEMLLDGPVRAPMAAVRAAPLVVGVSGQPLALGKHVFEAGISVRLTEAS